MGIAGVSSMGSTAQSSISSGGCASSGSGVTRIAGMGVWTCAVAVINASRRPRNSWICRSTSSGDVGGGGVDSREETRIGDEGRDIVVV